MGDTPTGNGRDRSDDETAKLELPSLRLARFGRRKQAQTLAPEPPARSERTEEQAERVEPVAPEPPAGVAATEPVVPSPEREPRQDETSAPVRSSALAGLSGRAVALVTGLIVGVLGALLTFASLRGCDALRGTQSCGGTAGLLLLAVILAVMVLVGALLLAWRGVPEARGTSFLAVGVLSVVVLLTLLEELFSPWMFLAVPVLTALSYGLAHWVTTTFVEPSPEPGPEHDVR